MQSVAPNMVGVTASARRLQACVRDLVSEVAQAGGQLPIVARLGERIEAMASELAWELGLDAAEDKAVLPRLDHLGVAVSNVGEAAALFVEHLGGTVVGGGSEQISELKSIHIAFAGGGKVELLESLGDTPIGRFIEKRGEGPHHLTFVVDDIAGIVAGLKHAGYRVVDEDLVTEGWKEAYVSPRSASGCLVQLVQAPADFGRPVYDVTLDAVVRDEWEWSDHRPRRRSTSAGAES